MATVTGFTAARMLVIENESIVDGDIVGDNLILKRRDLVTIDAGNVRGPLGNGPIGTVIDYIGVTAPSASWLTMTGQTVLNAQTLYPDLWAILPANLKSGSSLLMPETRQRVSAGYDVSDSGYNQIGKIGGSKTHTLIVAELPTHYHVVNPPATSISITDPGHIHTLYNTGQEGSAGSDPATSASISGVAKQTNLSTTGITGSVDIAPFNSADAGSGSPHNIVQPFTVFLKLLKVL